MQKTDKRFFTPSEILTCFSGSELFILQIEHTQPRTRIYYSPIFVLLTFSWIFFLVSSHCFSLDIFILSPLSLSLPCSIGMKYSKTNSLLYFSTPICITFSLSYSFFSITFSRSNFSFSSLFSSFQWTKAFEPLSELECDRWYLNWHSKAAVADFHTPSNSNPNFNGFSFKNSYR